MLFGVDPPSEMWRVTKRVMQLHNWISSRDLIDASNFREKMAGEIIMHAKITAYLLG